MKRLLTLATLLMSLTLSTSCENSTPAYHNNIKVGEYYGCTFHNQLLEIEYALDGGAAEVSATTTAEWITNIDTSEAGILRLDIAANDNKLRSATVTLTAEGHNAAKITISQIKAPEHTSHALMFYFFGTSLSRYFETNIKDAKAAIKSGALGDGNRVIYLYQNGSRAAYIREICYDPISRECIEYEVERIRLDASQITPSEIGANISLMASNVEADRYGIVFAGHGQGWIPREVLNNSSGAITLGTVNNPWQPAAGAEVTRALGENNVMVNPAEIAQGITKSGVELDYILFDACFMSNIEAIYELRESANYIIASPCEIMGNGFPYHRTLPYLCADNGEASNIIGAAESYYLFYRDEYVSSSRCGSVAVYNCAEIANLAEATNRVVATATNDYDKELLQTYEGQSVHYFYDFGEWVNVVATDTAALDNFNSQLAKTVIAKYTLPTFYSAYGMYGTYDINMEVYSGVTTSAPSDAYPSAWRKTSWYNDVFNGGATN